MGVSFLLGADVRVLKKDAGVPFTLAEIGAALEQHKPVMFFVTHGESSTGCLQDLEGIGALCARYACQSFHGISAQRFLLRWFVSPNDFSPDGGSRALWPLKGGEEARVGLLSEGEGLGEVVAQSCFIYRLIVQVIIDVQGS